LTICASAVSEPTAVARAQGAVLVDRRADQRRAGPLRDRHALAGHHRLVDLALALDHLGVDRHLGPGADQQQIADDNLGRRHLDRLAVPQDERLRRREVEQRPDRVVGAPASAHLEPVPEQHEAGEERGRLVEDIARDPERRRNRVDPAGPDRDRDQHHHVQRPRLQGEEGATEEDPGGVEDHRQAEEELPQLVPDPERRRRRRPEQALAERRPKRDREREGDRNQEAVAHVTHHRRHRHPGMAAVTMAIRGLGGSGVLACAGIPSFLRERVADVARDRAAGAVVAALLDPRRKRFDRRLLGVELDGGSLRDRVRLDRKHARPRCQHTLDDRFLTRVMEAADMKDGTRRRAHELRHQRVRVKR
jgi:hypothetical protein